MDQVKDLGLLFLGSIGHERLKLEGMHNLAAGGRMNYTGAKVNVGGI